MKGRFSFKALPIVVPTGGKRKEWSDDCKPTDESATLLDGRYSTVEQVDPSLRFQAIGACPVVFRASVIRVVFFKLIGTGVLAGLTAAGSSNPNVVKSCALAAAVNTVAVIHYFFIWRTRLQTLNIGPLGAVGVGLNRGTASFAEQASANAKKTFAQEIIVDSLRHSDWVVTLVLMQIDLGALADGAEPANEHWFGYHWTAALQPIIILLGSIPRFYLNDLRPRHNPKSVKARTSELALLVGGDGQIAVLAQDRQDAKPCDSIPQPWTNIVFGSICYVAGIALWAITTLNLLLHTGWPGLKTTSAASEDAYVIFLIAILQVGYPIMSTVQILWLNLLSKTLPGDEMDQTVSFVKDVVYGVLDTTAKGGLALFCALRATRGLL